MTIKEWNANYYYMACFKKRNTAKKEAALGGGRPSVSAPSSGATSATSDVIIPASAQEVKAAEEAAADFAGNMDENEIRKLTQENRSLAEKILDAIRSLIRKLKGGENQKLYEMEKLWASALKEGATKNIDTSGQAEYTGSKKKLKKYWRPKLNAEEWQLLNRSMSQEIGTEERWLDEATKWTYASEGGNTVFALYGVGDGTDATPLYVLSGEKAKEYYAEFAEEMEGRYDDGDKADAVQWAKSIRRAEGKTRRNHNADARRRSADGADEIYGKSSGRDTGRAAGTGKEIDARLTGEEGRNKKLSLKRYTEEEKKQHVKDAAAYFGRTYKWAETGYITTDGKRLDFSGRHEGGPGGYRTVDHRDIRDALGDDYGGDDYSGSMVQFMSEGNIRISQKKSPRGLFFGCYPCSDCRAHFAA